MPRLIRAALVAIAMLAALPIAAQPASRPQGATGYNAAERRAIDNRVAQLARTANIQAGIIARIAGVLEIEYPGLAASELIAKLESQVVLAEQLDKRIATLEQEIATLRGSGRDRASILLDAARGAFEQADFAAAETAFGELAGLLAQRQGADASLLVESTQARALSAELGGNEAGFVRAREYRLEARRQERERRRQSEIAEWQLCTSQVRADLQRVRTFGSDGVLELASLLARDCVDALGGSASDPLRWGQSQVLIGQVAAEMAQQADGAVALEHYEDAGAAYQAALAAIDAATHPVERGEALRWSGVMLVQHAFRIEGQDAFRKLDEADAQFAEAVRLYLLANHRDDAALAAADASVAWHTRSLQLSDAEKILALQTYVERGQYARSLLSDDASTEQRALLHGNMCTGNLELAVHGGRAGFAREQVARHLESAVAECRNALELHDPEAFPLPHASLQIIQAQVRFTVATFDRAQCPVERAAAEVDARAALAMFESSQQMAAMADYARGRLAQITAYRCDSAPET